MCHAIIIVNLVPSFDVYLTYNITVGSGALIYCFRLNKIVFSSFKTLVHNVAMCSVGGDGNTCNYPSMAGAPEMITSQLTYTAEVN